MGKAGGGRWRGSGLPCVAGTRMKAESHAIQANASKRSDKQPDHSLKMWASASVAPAWFLSCGVNTRKGSSTRSQ